MTYRLANSSEITFIRSDYLLSGVRLIHSGVENNRLHVGIKIDTFLDENLSNKVDQILKDCLKEHNKTAIGQLTIDLRGNGGGFVDEAINLASLFVEKGSTIIKYRYKDGSEKSFKTTTSRKYEIPQLYILQDHSSASASESFTLAMQDLSTDKLLNTKVIGTKSYGKGLVQSVKYFSDGSALRYTIAETLSPNGRSINKVGIVPDVDISYPFYYFGEQEQLNQSTKDFIVKSINFIMNEEYDLFNEASLKQFFNTPYIVTTEANRMGYRLQGVPLQQKVQHELLSSAVTYGTIQVPPMGQPIVLMGDRQTTGGYAKIDQVISTDLSTLAQCIPGTSILFKLVSLEEAQTILIREHRAYQLLKKIMNY